MASANRGTTRPRKGSARRTRAARPAAAEAVERDAARAEREPDPELRELPADALREMRDARRAAGDPLADYGIEAAERAGASREGFSPELAGGDVDASEGDAGTGEEAVGGSTPTPDQDNVDELGRAVGLTYQDDEPLTGGEEKIERRDDERWELNPASAEDFAERRGFAHAVPERIGRRR